MALRYFVGYTGFEPVTPALSRQCSEPTELITLARTKILRFKTKSPTGRLFNFNATGNFLGFDAEIFNVVS